MLKVHTAIPQMQDRKDQIFFFISC